MDYEDFLIEIYTPLKSIEFLSDIIYMKSNEDWRFYSTNCDINDFEELMALNFLTGLCAKHLLNFRRKELDNIKY